MNSSIECLFSNDALDFFLDFSIRGTFKALKLKEKHIGVWVKTPETFSLSRQNLSHANVHKAHLMSVGQATSETMLRNAGLCSHNLPVR